MSARSKSCVLVLSVYLSWQFSFAISHVSVDILAKSSADISGDRDSDLVNRANPEEELHLHRNRFGKENYDENGAIEKPVHVTDHINTEERINKSPNRKNNLENVDPIDQTHAYENIEKSILWSIKQGLSPAALKTRNKLPKETSQGREDILQNHSSNDHNPADQEEAQEVQKLIKAESGNSLSANSSYANLDYIIDDQKTQNNLFVSSKLSVSEDKLRTYTLSEGQRYGVGRAKPKHITAQLSRAKVIEYSEEDDTFSQRS